MKRKMAITKGYFSELLRSSIKRDFTESYSIGPNIVQGMLLDLMVILYEEDDYKTIRWLMKKYKKYDKGLI